MTKIQQQIENNDQQVKYLIETIRNRFDFNFNAGHFGKGEQLTKHKNNTEEDIKSVFRTSQTKLLEAVVEEFEKMIADEILVCHDEGTPTSRLTSLISRLEILKP